MQLLQRKQDLCSMLQFTIYAAIVQQLCRIMLQLDNFCTRNVFHQWGDKNTILHKNIRRLELIFLIFASQNDNLSKLHCCCSCSCSQKKLLFQLILHTKLTPTLNPTLTLNQTLTLTLNPTLTLIINFAQ